MMDGGGRAARYRLGYTRLGVSGIVSDKLLLPLRQRTTLQIH